MKRLLLVFATLALSGCYQEIRVDDPDGSPPPWDAGTRFIPPAGKCIEASAVDLLFVIDNSASMTEEQANLALQLPLLVERLVNPPDADADGRPDWEPLTDLQVGVISTDMGTGGYTIPTCVRPDGGDDAVLSTEGAPVLECAPVHPRVQRFDALAGISPAVFSTEVACATTLGTGGCGFEQPLEGALKGVTPATSALRFAGETTGHGDGINAELVRQDSLLAIVVLTDEEDCSARNLELFNPEAPFGDFGLRCFAHAGELHPAERYVEGLRALRQDRPDLLAFAVIAGIPPDLAGVAETDADLARMLDDPRMQERVDPDHPNRLIASCDTPWGLAFPPRRLVEVARGLGSARSTVQSICGDDLMPATEALARLLGGRSCRRYED